MPAGRFAKARRLPVATVCQRGNLPMPSACQRHDLPAPRCSGLDAGASMPARPGLPGARSGALDQAPSRLANGPACQRRGAGSARNARRVHANRARRGAGAAAGRRPIHRRSGAARSSGAARGSALPHFCSCQPSRARSNGIQVWLWRPRFVVRVTHERMMHGDALPLPFKDNGATPVQPVD